MKGISLMRNIAKWKINWMTLRPRPTQHHRLLSTQMNRPVIQENFDVVSPFADVQPEIKLPYQLVLDAFRRYSHLTAFECGLTGFSYTYGELLDRVLRLSGFLQKTGLGKGDVVSIFMPNSPHYPLVFMGIMASTASFSGINAAFTANEVRYQLQDSGAKAIVVDPVLEKIVQRAIVDLPNPPVVYVTGPSAFGRVNILEVVADKNIPFVNMEGFLFTEDDMCGLLYSSGTTGLPKGAVFRNGAVSAHIPMMLHPDIFPIGPSTKEHQETVIGLMPFFHAYGMYVVMIASLLLGVKVITLPMFQPEVFIALHKRHKIRIMHLVPPILQFLVSNPLVKPEDLAYTQIAMCTAAPCPADVALAFKEKCPNPVFFQEVYGMTETMPTHFTPLKGTEKIGSCGPLLPNTRAKIIDLNTGASLPPGQSGELYIKSPVLIREYHNRADATAEIFTEDDWLKTGDVAKYDGDGYFYIVDRIKELIKVKGAQVSPSELENCLLQHPGIADAGVIGVKDDRTGESPRAYVIKMDPSLTEEDVKTYLEDKVAPHKYLKGGVRFVKELPKNSSGKLLRKVLQEWSRSD